MLPPRASLPTTPVPGGSGLRSSSSTTASRPACTVGPPPPWVAVWPLVCTAMPFIPLSDEPMASTMMMLGSRSSICSFTVGEKIAALDESTNSDDRSQLSGRSWSTSTSGRAMASPVIIRC